jgi:uncharacterized repeat protein (TIGR01451 family)
MQPSPAPVGPPPGAWTAASAAAPQSDAATTFTPAEPRAVAESADPIRMASRRGLKQSSSPRAAAFLEPAPPPYEIYPDEYLFDGGDRGLAVHDGPTGRAGLESEDAVAEYSDTAGVAHILPTNRVAVYSPRFGSVSTTTGLETGVTVAGVASAVDLAHGEGLRTRVAPADHAQRLPSQGLRVRSRASGVEAEERQAGTQQGTVLSENVDREGSVEDVQNQGAPEMRQSQTARIAKRRQAAIAWTRNEFPVMTASIAGAHQVSARIAEQEMVGVEDRRTKGRLQIVKLADKETAPPGDVVSFTIQYENLGDLELKEVRIVDNLTPRLEYIAESGTSSRPATLSVTDNGEGSVVLTWSLKESLAGKASGSITFKAKVR